MIRMFRNPTVSPEWASSRETHMAVAVAIHAISDASRSPQDIWEEPTATEWDHVVMAVHDYISCGDFEAESDGNYAWGAEVITIDV